MTGKTPSLTLTVGEKGHYTVDYNGIELEGRAGMLVNQGALALKVERLDADPGSRFIVQQVSEFEAINDLQARLVVSERGKESGMLGVSLTGDDPVQLTRILDSITGNYLEQNISRQAAQDSRSLAFLQKQLPQVRGELDRAEEKLNEYRKQRDSIDLNLEAKSVLEQIVNVDNQLNELTFREAEISQLYKKDHPVYRALMDKRQMLRQEKIKLGQRISDMPATQQEILRLSRDVESGRAIYLQLLSRQQELSIAQSSATGNVRIIDHAVVSPKPVKPKKALIVILGFLLGGFLAAGLVLARQILRRNIDSPESLEEQGIMVLATVPMSDWLIKRNRHRGWKRVPMLPDDQGRRTPFPAIDNPGDLSVEAVRGLRTNLHFLMMDSPGNVLMITGATPGSGKTYISTALAAVIAQGGQKVLYIDADMRRGHAHSLFGMDNTQGLSDYLTGAANVSSIVRPFSEGSFDVVTCGTLPARPAELLLSERFHDLTTWATKHYDIVIIDTPPVLAVTDAAVISRIAGVCLVVARFGMNTVREMEVCIQRLQQAGGQVDGAILNGMLKRVGSYYRYGYHYGDASYSAD